MTEPVDQNRDLSDEIIIYHPKERNILDEVTITGEQANKYRDIAFKPIDLTTAELDAQTATQFCDNFRLGLTRMLTDLKETNSQVDYSQRENWANDVSSLDLLKVSGALGIPMILWASADLQQMGQEGGHWRLMLELPADQGSMVQMYDPTSKSLYESFVTKEEMNQHAFINPAVDKIESKYSLQIDQQGSGVEYLGRRLQVDDYNCGVAVFLNAMLRANHLGYISDEKRGLIEKHFGLKISDVPGGINVVD